MSKKTNSNPKTKAWNEYSRWVKVRDCLETTTFPFVGECITCGRRFHIRYLQAGHCFPGRRNALLFQDELVHAQCQDCNEIFHGRQKRYQRIMEKRYTIKQVAKWEAEGKKVIHDKDMDFPSIEKKYHEKTNQLLRQHGRYISYEDMLKEKQP